MLLTARRQVYSPSDMEARASLTCLQTENIELFCLWLSSGVTPQAHGRKEPTNFFPANSDTYKMLLEQHSLHLVFP